MVYRGTTLPRARPQRQLPGPGGGPSSAVRGPCNGAASRAGCRARGRGA